MPDFFIIQTPYERFDSFCTKILNFAHFALYFLNYVTYHRWSILVHDEGKTSWLSGERIHFDGHRLDWPELLEVLFQLGLAGLPTQPSDEQFAVLGSWKKIKMSFK